MFSKDFQFVKFVQDFLAIWHFFEVFVNSGNFLIMENIVSHVFSQRSSFIFLQFKSAFSLQLHPAITRLTVYRWLLIMDPPKFVVVDLIWRLDQIVRSILLCSEC